MGDVRGTMTFTVETGRKPVSASAQPGGRVEYQGHFEPYAVLIRDARPLAGALSLDTQGFVLARLDAQLADLVESPEAMRRHYYPRVEALIGSLTGASEVFIFDHTVRTSDPAEQEAKGRREPVQVVHNDYTEWSAPQRVRDLLPERAEELLRRRFAVVQLWQPIRGPVVTSPLAICDARSIPGNQLIAAERRHPDRVGETYHVVFDPDQRWYYVPRMEADEVLVFKTYDSVRDGRARFTAHGSFTVRRAPADAPPRESVEVRSFAFFE